MKQYLRREVITILGENLEDLSNESTKAGHDYIKGIQRGVEILYINLVNGDI